MTPTTIHVNLHDAFLAFVSYIAAANRQHSSTETLKVVHKKKLDGFNQSLRTLSQLASAGMEEQLAPLLSTLLQEWAIKEAIELLLRSRSEKIDPADQGLQQAFWEHLDRQYQKLSCDLLLQLQRGREQRAREQEERAQSWHNTASQWVQHQQEMNQQWLQNQQEMFTHLQQENREWANTAMVGAQQAQLGLQQWYTFAAGVQSNVANMLAGSEQRQAQIVRRENTNRWLTPLMILGLLALGFLTLFGCSFFAMTHLY